MTGIRDNPPASVNIADTLAIYQTLYDDITNNGTILRYDDRHALGELAVTLHEMQVCRDDIAIEGMMMTVQGDRNVVTKKNPAVDILQKLQVHVKSMFKEFGMTPASRGKPTHDIENADQDDEWNKV